MTGKDDPVGPDGAELPDERPDLESLEPFETDADAFEDINDFATDEWEESTTGRERIEDIVRLSNTPLTVGELAEKARVSEPTARSHLEKLVDQNQAIAEPSDRGTRYQRDPDWHRLQRIHRLAEEPKSTLEQVLRDLMDEINDYQDIYGTDSPEDLIIKDEHDLRDEDWQNISHWRTAETDRAYIRAGLALKQIGVVEEKHGDRVEASLNSDEGMAVDGSR